MADLVISVTFADTTGCCGGTTCYLTMPTLLIDGTTTNYANSTAATAAIAAQVVGCLIEMADNTNGTITASVTSSILTVTQSLNFPPNSAAEIYICEASLSASGNIKVDFTISIDSSPYNIILSVYQSDGTTLVGSDSKTSTASGTLTVAVGASGTYFVKITYGISPPATPTFMNVTANIYSNVGITFCAVRAAYDDGAGGTAYVICV